jgi:hypothetical protein
LTVVQSERGWWLVEINGIVMFAGFQQGDDFEIRFTGGAGVVNQSSPKASSGEP